MKSARPTVSVAWLRALEQIGDAERRGVPLRKYRRVACGHLLAALEDAGLVVRPRLDWLLTPTGEMLLEAYRLGRSRWGCE